MQEEYIQEGKEPAPREKVVRTKRMKSDYAWIAAIITALGTSVGSIIGAKNKGDENAKIQESIYAAATVRLAVVEYRLTQVEALCNRPLRLSRSPSSVKITAPELMASMTEPVSMPSSQPVTPSYEQIQQHVKKTGEAFKKADLEQ